MAYIKEIERPCEASGCRKRASHEVFNNKNASVGRFCKADAERARARLQKLELGLKPNESLKDV